MVESILSYLLVDNCGVIGSVVGWLLVLLCTTFDWLVTCLGLGSSSEDGYSGGVCGVSRCRTVAQG